LFDSVVEVERELDVKLEYKSRSFGMGMKGWVLVTCNAPTLVDMIGVARVRGVARHVRQLLRLQWISNVTVADPADCCL
jgi:hypothetical protein